MLSIAALHTFFLLYVHNKHTKFPLSSASPHNTGLGEEHNCVHIMFVFKDPSKDAAYDDSVALSFKLPILL